MDYAVTQPLLPEAGCDEAGRGSYAGPVFAAAVILPEGFSHPWLNDSKKVKPEHRRQLRVLIEQQALAYAVASVEPERIDQINILKATLEAMHRALDQLTLRPRFLLIDGNRFAAYGGLPHRCVVGGDGLLAPIAAASILAKTYRDEYMLRLHHEFPQYGWDRNKGYGTAFHRQAIAGHGLCKYHRRSFDIIAQSPALF